MGHYWYLFYRRQWRTWEEEKNTAAIGDYGVAFDYWQWRNQTKKFGVAAIKKTCGKNGKKYKEVPPKYVTPIHRENPKPTMASNNEAEVYTSIEQAYPCLTPELAKHHWKATTKDRKTAASSADLLHQQHQKTSKKLKTAENKLAVRHRQLRILNHDLSYGSCSS